jgi:hypothetical protein
MEVNGYKIEPGANLSGANLIEMLQFEAQIKETSN